MAAFLHENAHSDVEPQYCLSGTQNEYVTRVVGGDRIAAEEEGRVKMKIMRTMGMPAPVLLSLVSQNDLIESRIHSGNAVEVHI